MEIITAGGDAEYLRAQGGQAGGDVASAAGALFAVAFLDDGDGGFGGEAFGVAVDVFVDHHIAEQHDARVGPFFDEGDEVVGLGVGRMWASGSIHFQTLEECYIGSMPAGMVLVAEHA